MNVVNSSHSRLSAWKIFAQDSSRILLGRCKPLLTCLLVSMLSRIRMRISFAGCIRKEKKRIYAWWSAAAYPASDQYDERDKEIAGLIEEPAALETYVKKENISGASPRPLCGGHRCWNSVIGCIASSLNYGDEGDDRKHEYVDV